MVYILNALPGAIIPAEGGNLDIQPLSWGEFAEVLGHGPWTSAVGHADTARLVSGACGVEIPENRISVPPLRHLQRALLALYQGPRLPEGATELPEGATLTPYLLKFEGPR